MPRRARLDAELVRRGLARSREQAVDLIGAGAVRVGGMIASKPATGVTLDAAIVVDDTDDPGYASRGAYKLRGALDEFGPRGLVVAGRRALDAGASTGGFTDVLLREDVDTVIAVDVGYGQLDWRLRSDDRVVVLDRTNVRSLSLDDLDGGAVDLVVADLSFISLRLVLPAFAVVTDAGGDWVLMVKPQFEVGKGRTDHGVVRDPAARAAAVTDVLVTAAGLGWGTVAVAPSPLPGPSGNVEYFGWLRRAGATDLSPGDETMRDERTETLDRTVHTDPADLTTMAAAAVTAGPDGPHGAGGEEGRHD